MSITISHEPLERSYLVVEPGTHGDNYYRYTIIILKMPCFVTDIILMSQEMISL